MKLPDNIYRVAFIVLLLIFSVYVVTTSNRPDPALAQQSFIMGYDPDNTTHFVIRDGSDVKLRIDENGAIIAPFKFPPQGEGLVLNGSFETDVNLDGTPDNWIINFDDTSTGGSTTIEDTNTTYIRHGEQTLALSVGSTSVGESAASDIFPVEPNKKYNVSFDVRASTAMNFSSPLAKVYYYAGDDTTQVNSPSNDTETVVTDTAVLNAWEPQSGTFTVPNTATCGPSSNKPCTKARFVFYIDQPDATGTLYFDNVRLTTSRISDPIPAAVVSAGQFGKDVGLGNFTFEGNVGVGTTTANAKLEVGGSSSTISNTSGQILIQPTTNLEIQSQYGTDIVNKGNTSGTMTIDWDDGMTQYVTLTGNITTTNFNNGQSGRRYTLIIAQGGSGSYTVAWPGTANWPAATTPTLTTDVGARDYIGFIYNSVDSEYDGIAARLNL